MVTFTRREDLEINGGQVFVACWALHSELNGKAIWRLSPNSAFFTTQLMQYLTIPTPPTGETWEGMSIEERDAYIGARTRYYSALEYLGKVLTEAMIDQCFPTELFQATSRMGEPFCGMVVARRIPVRGIRIARGGDRVTLGAMRQVEQSTGAFACCLYATSQRKPGQDGEMTAEFTTKGQMNLDGSFVPVFEQANATGITVAATVRGTLKRNAGEPKQLIFGYFNSCAEGVRATLKAFPGAMVFVLMLHNGINEKKYLVGPGCGDVGAVDSGCLD